MTLKEVTSGKIDIQALLNGDDDYLRTVVRPRSPSSRPSGRPVSVEPMSVMMSRRSSISSAIALRKSARSPLAARRSLRRHSAKRRPRLRRQLCRPEPLCRQRIQRRLPGPDGCGTSPPRCATGRRSGVFHSAWQRLFPPVASSPMTSAHPAPLHSRLHRLLASRQLSKSLSV